MGSPASGALRDPEGKAVRSDLSGRYPGLHLRGLRRGHGLAPGASVDQRRRRPAVRGSGHGRGGGRRYGADHGDGSLPSGLLRPGAGGSEGGCDLRGPRGEGQVRAGVQHAFLLLPVRLVQETVLSPGKGLQPDQPGGGGGPGGGRGLHRLALFPGKGNPGFQQPGHGKLPESDLKHHPPAHGPGGIGVHRLRGQEQYPGAGALRR